LLARRTAVDAQAVEAMPKAVTLIETAKKLLVQRITQQEHLPR